MKTLILVLCLAATTVFAHEGHDHDAPKGIKAPNRGQLRNLENTIVEAVVKAKDIQVYFYDLQLVPQEAGAYTVSAKVQLPRAKKQEEIVLSIKDKHLEGIFDAKGAHRYTLFLKVKDPKATHADNLKFIIEPKK